MTAITTQVETRRGTDPDRIPYDELMAAQKPVVFKGLASAWPLVKAGLSSPDHAINDLKRFYQGKPVVVYRGEPAIKGRFFYNSDLTGFNFQPGTAPLGDVLDEIARHGDDPAAPSLYIGSTDIDLFLPGLRAENDLVLNTEMFSRNRTLMSIWIGNRTTATAHYDMSHNLAVCVAGHRRFTLFPPEQIFNLYPGPLEPTPGGQVVSLVDFTAPDYVRFPKFREAEAAGMIADMEPGDVLFYPALWWHHVEALDPFNILINYWWNTTPAFIDSPMNTLLHALLSLRDRPAAEKAAWKSVFDYYIFGSGETATAHIPEAAQGNLAPLDDLKARRLRAMILGRLNR